jgi:hypothetical protein
MLKKEEEAQKKYSDLKNDFFSPRVEHVIIYGRLIGEKKVIIIRK